MKKNINYNYVFLFYDVNVKRVNKVFKNAKISQSLAKISI